MWSRRIGRDRRIWESKRSLFYGFAQPAQRDSFSRYVWAGICPDRSEAVCTRVLCSGCKRLAKRSREWSPSMERPFAARMTTRQARKHCALPHLRSAFSPPLLRAKCGVHENIKGRSYVRQCALMSPFVPSCTCLFLVIFIIS